MRETVSMLKPKVHPMKESTRVSYAHRFITPILQAFHMDEMDTDMKVADRFRHDEWQVVGSRPYAVNTRNDLFDMAENDPYLHKFIEDVISCMEYNLQHEETIPHGNADAIP